MHRYFYWSTDEEISRVLLGSARTTSASCTGNFAQESSQILVSLSSLTTFTIEQGEALYFHGEYNCTNPSQVVDAVLSTSLDGTTSTLYHFRLLSIQQIESFTKRIIFSAGSSIGYFQVTNEPCPENGIGIQFLDIGTTVDLIRMYRSNKQPQPSM